MGSLLRESARTKKRPGLERDASRSYGDARAENLFVHADNHVALPWLLPKFRGLFRCVYLDPPYNTGRAFAHYDDRASPEEWRSTMVSQLEAMAPLLAEDGAIFAEIDDTELASLQGAMDQIFGRAQRVSTVTIVRSAPTGHKAKNRGPVNVTDFLLVYAKDKTRFRPRPLVRPRRDYDFAYGTWLEGALDDPSTWTFSTLSSRVARHVGCESLRLAKKRLGDDAFERALVRFALENAERVVRFAQPRFDAVSQEARHAIMRSKGDPTRIVVVNRTKFAPIHLHRGNRVLFLRDKVRMGERGPHIVEPLTNVWDDVPFQGIAKEGGVAYVRNKKPERLMERILAMSTDPGDWVLDPFAGSGTTAAVAHKMGRRWVSIERSDSADALVLPRLRRVVDGSDLAGVTRSHGFEGGGGFAVIHG